MQHLAGTLLEAVWAGILLGSGLFQASNLLGFVNLQTGSCCPGYSPCALKASGKHPETHQKCWAEVRLSQIPALPG